MDKSARVFLHVHPGDANPLWTIVALDVKVPADRKGPVVLGDLETLVQVRVEVILSRELRLLRDLAV
ncbi:MAG: hypothetical protein A4E42_00682 [Methanoregulaceae archaeon PtaU1.Bin222]|nr:MAG: hypothetical protein A4E42_00682 [Methanoregulaceae archaeon PtaU1.Bin222]